MKLTKLHLIIILALALIICPILGVCNNTREYFQQEETSYGQLGGNIDSEGFKGEEEEEEGFEGHEIEEGFYNKNREGLNGDYQQYQDQQYQD
jgi:hypothetical protein